MLLHNPPIANILVLENRYFLKYKFLAIIKVNCSVQNMPPTVFVQQYHSIHTFRKFLSYVFHYSLPSNKFLHSVKTQFQNDLYLYCTTPNVELYNPLLGQCMVHSRFNNFVTVFSRMFIQEIVAFSFHALATVIFGRRLLTKAYLSKLKIELKIYIYSTILKKYKHTRVKLKK